MNTGRYARFLPVVRTLALQVPEDQGCGHGLRAWAGDPQFRLERSAQGSSADVDGRIEDRSEALHWISHAGANAITNAARCGTPLDGCVMLVTHPPCMACAKLIVQAGIKVVLCPTPDEEFSARWADDLYRSERLLDECGVTFNYLTEDSC